MIATLAASALFLAPVPPGKAFDLPSVRQCVRAHVLTLSVRPVAAWKTLTVRVDGRRVKRVTRPSPRRKIRLRDLPAQPFELTVQGRTQDGRSATVRRTFHPCAPGGEPTVAFPEGAPPTTLVTRDLVVGTGARPRRDDEVGVHYVMATWSNRMTIDSSWDRRELFSFPLGREVVIAGFEQGLAGMRVGGRREIVIPPHLGYGDAGSPPVVPGSETLVAVVDLVAVRR